MSSCVSPWYVTGALGQFPNGERIYINDFLLIGLPRKVTLARVRRVPSFGKDERWSTNVELDPVH
jgi:hypothetical protein